MRLISVMEENRDTAGWGLLGIVTGFVLYTNWVDQAGAAALVAAAGMLSSLITKKLYNYLYNYVEGKVTSWWKNRKTKTNNQ